jgi:hypothetical protein
MRSFAPDVATKKLDIGENHINNTKKRSLGDREQACENSQASMSD